MAWRIGVDSGGTFTDVCLFDDASGRVEVWKVPSTPDDPSRGIAQGVEEGVQRVGICTPTQASTRQLTKFADVGSPMDLPYEAGHGNGSRLSPKEGVMKRENRKENTPDVNGVAPRSNDLLIQKRIALRAYELYLHRSGVDGHAEEDWLQAEREILEEERH